MRHVLFISAMALAGFASVARGGILYELTIDTRTIAGTAGSLDFNFNPGPLVTQAASLDISSFLSDGTPVSGSCALGGPCLTGDVSGTLPGTLTFDNGTGFNDYFQDFTFGNTLMFDVRLYGPAVNSPDGISTSGSTFAFSMFSDAAGTIPILTSDLTDGFAATIGLNLDGTSSVNNFSAETTVSAVPEPSSFVLVVVVALGMLCRCRRWFSAQ